MPQEGEKMDAANASVETQIDALSEKCRRRGNSKVSLENDKNSV